MLFAGGYFANGGQAALPLVMLSGFVAFLISLYVIRRRSRNRKVPPKR